METEVGQRKHPAVTGIVSLNVIKDELPLYEQAAQNTGFGLSVSAREGQPHTFRHRGEHGEMEMKTVIIPAGRLGITVRRLAEQKDHSAFWKEYKKLEAEQSSPK